MDFVWTRGSRAVGIEVKATQRWRPADGAALRGLVDDGALRAGYGVYTGTAELKDGPLRVRVIVGARRCGKYETIWIVVQVRCLEH